MRVVRRLVILLNRVDFTACSDPARQSDEMKLRLDVIATEVNDTIGRAVGEEEGWPSAPYVTMMVTGIWPDGIVVRNEKCTSHAHKLQLQWNRSVR